LTRIRISRPAWMAKDFSTPLKLLAILYPPPMLSVVPDRAPDAKLLRTTSSGWKHWRI